MNEELIVSTLEDENDDNFCSGDLSLREAIALANEREGADTITFDSNLSGGAIDFNESLERDLIIDDSVSINGLGQDNLTLNGGFIFNVESDVDLAIDGLNLVGGKIDSFGDLTLTNSTISETVEVAGISDNSSIIGRGTTTIVDSSIVDNDGGDDIGILIESGTATIEGSTIANNEGVLGGSGVLILTDETVDISNSTIANNRNRFVGGVANAGGGTVKIANTTIANNNGGLGSGGIQNSFGTVTVTSSILAGNTGGPNVGDVSGDGEFISGGNNLISNGDDAEGFADGVNGDIVGSNGDDASNPQTDLLIDARLGELQDNGGSTQTLALLDGSPAIDAGSNPNNLETDQRGVGFDRTVGDGTDIGAFEVQQGDGGGNSTKLVVSTLDDENDGNFSAGDLSLREAIANSNDGNTIIFDSRLSGGTIVLNQGALSIEKDLSIQGLGIDNLIIDGNNSDRVFKIDDDNAENFLDVDLSDLTITGGQNTFTFPPNDPNFDVAFGGGIHNQENLNLNNSKITDNSSGNLGGGIYNGSGVLNLNNNQVVNNGTYTKGGGIYNDLGTVNITASTIDSNAATGERRIGALGGGIFNREGILTINRSTISNNSANSAHGGIDNGGILSLTNSTVSGNDGAMGVGGIKNSDTAKILNSTIAKNNGAAADGISNFTGAKIKLTSSIVTSNSNNILLRGDIFTSQGNNLISNGDGVEIINQTEVSDLIGTTDNPLDPQLGELQDNGGSTQTIALLDGSPAIDAGSNPNNLETDQRGEGFDRTVGNGTDIGAFEVQDLKPEQPDSDRLEGTHDNDRIKGTDRDETIFGFGGDDILKGGAGNDTLKGGVGRDTLKGGASDDLLKGNKGNDKLYGGHGDDTLIGGAGRDTLLGGRGHDIFVLESFTEHDVITDFVLGKDCLQLSEGLCFERLNIVNNESNTGTLIVDSTNNSVVAAIDNVHAVDLTIHEFC